MSKENNNLNGDLDWLMDMFFFVFITKKYIETEWLTYWVKNNQSSFFLKVYHKARPIGVIRH